MFVADDTNGVVFANQAAANLYGTARCGVHWWIFTKATSPFKAFLVKAPGSR
jgi:hypothetical protein